MWDENKKHFEWLLWHWYSLGQLNLEPTRPNGLVGCKCQLSSWRSASKKSRTWVFIIQIPVGHHSVSHTPMHCDLVTRQSIKEWHKLGLGSSLAFWVVKTINGAIASTWLVVLSKISNNAWNSYGQLLKNTERHTEKDIHIPIVLIITFLQN